MMTIIIEQVSTAETARDRFELLRECVILISSRIDAPPLGTVVAAEHSLLTLRLTQERVSDLSDEARARMRTRVHSDTQAAQLFRVASTEQPTNQLTSSFVNMQPETERA